MAKLYTVLIEECPSLFPRYIEDHNGEEEQFTLMEALDLSGFDSIEQAQENSIIIKEVATSDESA